MKVVKNLSVKPFRRMSAHLPSSLNNGKVVGENNVRVSGIFGDCIYNYLKGNIVSVVNTPEVEVIKLVSDETYSIYNKQDLSMMVFGDENNDWLFYSHLVTAMANEKPGPLLSIKTEDDILDVSNDMALEEVFSYMWNMCKDTSKFPNEVKYEDLSELDLSPYEKLIKEQEKEKEPEEVKTVEPISQEDMKIVLDREMTDDERMRIPKFDFDVINVPDYVKHTVSYVKSRLDRGQYANALYFGPSGTGKSTSVKILAALLNVPHYLSKFSHGTDEFSIVAGADVDSGTVSYNDSELVKAVKHGGVVELQEFYNAKPGVLSSLNTVLEEGYLELANGKIIKRHPQCVIVATSNIFYEGGQAIDTSVDSRFKLKILVDEVSDDELMHRLMLGSGYKDKKVLKKLVKSYRDIKAVLEKEEYDEGIADIRALEGWAELIGIGIPVKEAAYMSFLPTISKEKAKMDEIMDSYIRNLF